MVSQFISSFRNRPSPLNGVGTIVADSERVTSDLVFDCFLCQVYLDVVRQVRLCRVFLFRVQVFCLFEMLALQTHGYHRLRGTLVANKIKISPGPLGA